MKVSETEDVHRVTPDRTQPELGDHGRELVPANSQHLIENLREGQVADEADTGYVTPDKASLEKDNPSSGEEDGVGSSSLSAAANREPNSQVLHQGPPRVGRSCEGAGRELRVDGRAEPRNWVDLVDQREVPELLTRTEAGSWPGTLSVVNASEELVSKKPDSHVIDIPVKDGLKGLDFELGKTFSIPRTTSNFSVESATGELCRICQQYSEEAVFELGCQCRGELAKAHQSCIEQWFGNKGTNKCEVCQHVAVNVPAPAAQPTPHFWVWRIGGGPYNGGGQRRGVGPFRLSPLPMRPVLLMTFRRHPTIILLWLLLFAFMAYLFVDVTDSASIGYAAMPIGFLFGVLVVLGLGTAARLILECWQERVIRRNIRRMEEEPGPGDLPLEQSNVVPDESVNNRSPVGEGADITSPAATRQVTTVL